MHVTVLFRCVLRRHRRVGLRSSFRISTLLKGLVDLLASSLLPIQPRVGICCAQRNSGWPDSGEKLRDIPLQQRRVLKPTSLLPPSVGRWPAGKQSL